MTTNRDIFDRAVPLGEPTPGEVPVGEELRQIGYDWHGGQASALYSMASVGTIAGYRHQQALLAELRADLRWVATAGARLFPTDCEGQAARLQQLIDFVERCAFPGPGA